jgi:hypothetical protein
MEINIKLIVSPPFMNITIQSPGRTITLSNAEDKPFERTVKILQDLIYTSCRRATPHARNRLYVRTINELKSMESYRKRRWRNK